MLEWNNKYKKLVFLLLKFLLICYRNPPQKLHSVHNYKSLKILHKVVQKAQVQALWIKEQIEMSKKWNESEENITNGLIIPMEILQFTGIMWKPIKTHSITHYST
jgi:hypothetical protein